MISPGILASIIDINGPSARKYTDRNTVYVSPTGKDGYLGHTPNLPVKSITGIKREISKLKTGASKKIKVKHLPGKYTAKDFFFSNSNYQYFAPGEAGDDNFSIDFEAVNKDTVVFDNSKKYTGFEQVGDLWRLKIDNLDIHKCSIFGFVNDTRSVPARWPKYGTLSEHSRVTYQGNSYIRCVDSTGFLKAILDYSISNNYIDNIPYVGYNATVDYRSFNRTTLLPPLTSRLGNGPYDPTIFYLKTSESLQQIYANPCVFYTAVLPTSGVYYYATQNITYRSLTAAPLYFEDNFGSIEDFIRDYGSSYLDDIYLHEYNPTKVEFFNEYTRAGIDEWMYRYYFEDTDLGDKFIKITLPLVNNNQKNFYLSEGSSFLNDYAVNLSNLDPYIVCSVPGENTIIRDGSNYFFYYKPTTRDIEVGINNSVLETFNIGNKDYWLRSSFGNSYNITPEGQYSFFNRTTETTNTNGYLILEPKNITFKDITFKYLQSPIVLTSPVRYGFNESQQTKFNRCLSRFTSNVNISGCKFLNIFGSGVEIQNVSKSNIFKNLFYSCEATGLDYRCGHDIKINNNILKNCQQVDTRLNNDTSGIGTLFVHGDYLDSHGYPATATLTGVDISNNDCSFAGNVVITGVMQNLSTYKNKIYNAGFGANSDMSALHYGHHYTQTGVYNYVYNNLIYNSRANTNNHFLGNLLYYDGGSGYIKTFNNIFANGQTGIQYTCVRDCDVTNNIFYDCKIASMTVKNNNGSLYSGDRPVKINTNIFVVGSGSGGTRNAFIGWPGQSAQTRSIKSNNLQLATYGYTNTAGVTGTVTLTPLYPWNGKLRYARIATGGTGTITDPEILFNGTNWVGGFGRGNRSDPDGIWYMLSSYDTSQYDYPWDIPSNKWIILDNNWGYRLSAIKAGWSYRNDNKPNPGLSSFNNLFWSTLPASSTINNENNTDFFTYNGLFFGNVPFSGINAYANIPDPYKRNDNSLPNLFNPLQLSEIGSVLQDPLFVDPANKDFRLANNSPALNLGFTPIDQSDVGVYNTPDDPYWSLSALNLKPQPVIYGNANWADYTTIPYPYNSLKEYYLPQYIHVARFGAVGDGVTDDQPAIQRAINYCSDNGIETLYFGSGVYYLSSAATGTGTSIANTNGVGYGAGEYLNIGFYPDPLTTISYSNMINSDRINYRPTNPKRINLTLIGTGSTILSAKKEDRVTRFGGQASIIALRENINNFKMKGLSLVWDGNLTGNQEFQSQGVIIASNYGGASYGRSVHWPIDRNKIEIVDCTFINCNRAITSSSSILSGRGTKTVNITGCNFLYPKGSDSTSTYGGSQVLFFNYDTLNLNITDNFAEGTTTIPVKSPNYKAKDGFIFYGGINNRFERNTMTRFDIETIYCSTGSPSVFCSNGSIVPPVGGTIALTAGDVVLNPGGANRSSIHILTAYQGFNIGDIVTGTSNIDGYYASYGIYRIDNFIEKPSINSYEIRATRLSGSNYGGEYANLRAITVGRRLSAGGTLIVPFNYQNKIGNKSYVLDNNFTPGLALSSPTYTVFSHQPAVRADAGYVYLSGNTIPAQWSLYGQGQGGYDFKSEWMVENNTFYCCSSANSVDIMNFDAYNCTVKNNSFYFWSDFSNNNSLVYTSPKKITNGYRGGTSWAGVYINWGQESFKQAYSIGADMGSTVIVDNNFYCTYPLSANTIIPVIGQTKFDIVSGNIITNLYP